MKTFSIRRWRIFILVVLVAQCVAVQAQGTPKTIVLGTDLSEPQRAALLQRFGAIEGTDKILTISGPETSDAMQSVIPVAPGYLAVSSTALTCASPGSGLRVATENIQKVTAGMYAGALLTAGIGDAELIVAAPADAPAEGMTALAGLFKSFQEGACGRGEVDPARRNLAYSWLATTAGLGDALEDQNAATRLVLSAHQALITGGKGNPAAVEPALDGAIATTGIALPPEQRPALLDLLLRIALAQPAWGDFALGWNLDEANPADVRLVPLGDPAPPSTTITGSVREAAGPGTPLVIEAPEQTQQLNLAAAGVVVTRDSQPATLADLRSGDSLTMEVGADNVVQRIDASSASVAGSVADSVAGSVVVGTVNQNTEGQLLLMTLAGEREFSVPSEAAVVREGRDTRIADVEADDSAVIMLDAAGNVISVFARGTGNAYVVEGTTTGAIRDHKLELQADGQLLNVPLPLGEGAQVVRDGQAAPITDIQPNDRVTIRFDETGAPVSVAAQSPMPSGWRSFLTRYRWLGLLCLVPLILLFPLLFSRRRRAGRAILVVPGGRRAIDPDDIDGIQRQ